MRKGNLSHRALYNLLDGPGESALKEAHDVLNRAVLAAYGFRGSADTLTQLLDLNMKLATREDAGEMVIGPGVPEVGVKRADVISSDRVRPDTPRAS